MRINKWVVVGLGILISLVFLWLAFGNLELDAVLSYIRQVNLGLLALAVIVFMLSVVLIAWRWGFLLRAVQVIPLSYLTQLVLIGYMGNNVYPFRSGEVLRVVLLQHNQHVPLAKSATTVVVERVFDGLVMLTFVVTALMFINLPSPEVRAGIQAAAIVFLGLVAVFFVLAFRPGLMRALLRLVERLLPKRLAEIVNHIGEGILSGLEGLRSPRDLAGAVFASYASWLVHAVVYWLVAFAFGLQLSYATMLLAVGMVNLAGLIPASPGMIGVFEYFGGMALTAVGIPNEQAQAFALVAHVVVWLPATVLGFYYLLRQGLSWSDITHAREMETKAAGSEV
ncbi:MAG TPA: lysylphosphatidylglycerol synthase transmembrane domain-containing protein [Phototrophicaceae bacterium]|nr:lysylphosphatidylglycerol synthase transmembrane domain-containing protein [Phototrophicaceae bacterium]